jgi:hypothetical protein
MSDHYVEFCEDCRQLVYPDHWDIAKQPCCQPRDPKKVKRALIDRIESQINYLNADIEKLEGERAALLKELEAP